MRTYHTTPPQSPAFEEAAKVIQLLKKAGFHAYFVGGCVRDLLLRRKVSDFDIATSALPEAVMKALEPHFKVFPTGIQHGTVSAVSFEGRYEITTFRHDVATDGRHAVVQFGTSLEEDARRRDFTINSLYMDEAGTIFDSTGGWGDIKAKKLRFVGDAQKRIDEDFLRALRLIRFWAQLGFKPQQKELRAVEKSLPKLKHLSRERIVMEVRKLVTGNRNGDALKFFFAKNFPHYLWKMNLKHLKEKTVAQILKKTPEELRWQVFLLLLVENKTAKKAEDILRDLKIRLMDRVILTRAMKLLERLRKTKLPADEYLLGFVDEVEKDQIDGFFLEEVYPVLKCAVAQKNLHKRLDHLKKLERKFQTLRLETQHIDAEALMREKGLKPGPALGNAIARERLRRRRLEVIS